MGDEKEYTIIAFADKDNKMFSNNVYITVSATSVEMARKMAIMELRNRLKLLGIDSYISDSYLDECEVEVIALGREWNDVWDVWNGFNVV